MTDKDMVLEVGKQIIALEQEITGLKAILMSTRQPDGKPIPWQWLMERDMPTLLPTMFTNKSFMGFSKLLALLPTACLLSAISIRTFVANGLHLGALLK
jgi:hypothetical protein